MKILIICPRAVPPWDSATASLVKSRLLLLTHPRIAKFFDSVDLLTVFRDYKKVVHFHENVFGNEIYYDYFDWLRQLGIKAYFIKDRDPDLSTKSTQCVLNYIIRSTMSSGAYNILWCIGCTLLLPCVRQKHNKILMLVENFVQSQSSVILDEIANTCMHIATSKTIYYKLKKRSTLVIYLPPAIDTKLFSPQSIKRSIINGQLKDVVENSDIRLLYMGPLMHDRFPIEVIVPALRKLKSMGYKPILVAFCTVRNKESLKYYKHVTDLIHRYGLGHNLVIKLRVFVNDFEKVSVYNSFDAILYIPIMGREMADPPLTILEAMSCGLPPIATPLGDIEYIISRYSAGVILHKLDPDVLIESILEVINNRERLSKIARKVVDTFYSVEAVARLAHKVFTRILQ